MVRVSLFRLGKICLSKESTPSKWNGKPVWNTICGTVQPVRYSAITKKRLTCDVCRASIEAVELEVEEQFEKELY